MLLTLLNWYGSGGPPPKTYSTNYGTLCLETTIETTTLTGAVLIDELAAAVLIGELEATLETTTLVNPYVC